jgi:predicted transcriptional regulator
MLDYSVVEKAVPEIIQRVTSGKSVILEKRDGTKVRITPKKEEIFERRETVKSLREDGLTQQEIADELGVHRNTVNSDLCTKNEVYTKEIVHKEPRKVTQYKISQYTKPEVAAKKIREIFGDEFADRLDEELSR